MTIQVPDLSQEAIERDAEALLAEYAHARGAPLELPIPIEDIIEKHLKLRIEFDDLHEVLRVPRTGPKAEIFGAIWLDKGEICVDESLDPEEHPELEGRYRFTLAHEGGHWRLHRAYVVTNPTQAPLSDGPSRPAVICRSSHAKERVERQADFHASCLLMPRTTVTKAWRRELGKMVSKAWRRELKTNALKDSIVYEFVGHARHRPRWAEPSRIDQMVRDEFKLEHPYLLDQLAKRFARKFGVSAQAMRIRLEKLGLLHLEDPRQWSLAVGS